MLGALHITTTPVCRKTNREGITHGNIQVRSIHIVPVMTRQPDLHIDLELS